MGHSIIFQTEFQTDMAPIVSDLSVTVTVQSCGCSENIKPLAMKIHQAVNF